MIDVAILGSTGVVGQRFVSLLSKHPFFKIREVFASENKKGRNYVEVVDWVLENEIPEEIINLKIKSIDEGVLSKVIFSALPKEESFEIEDKLSKEGYFVFSNSSSHRYDKFVPILVPEVNIEHIDSVKKQNRSGFIITNPNCTTTGIVLSLKPVLDNFGIKKVLVVSMQAISGAGIKGLSSLKILGNLIPFIENEEEKIEIETRKILGKFSEEGFIPNNFDLEARCNRVPIRDGHTIVMFVETEKRVEIKELIEVLENFEGLPQKLYLPLAPKKPIKVFKNNDRPQPILDVNYDNGMAISVGRIKESSFFSFTITSLVHNTIRGAAGGSILNAEVAFKLGYLRI
ncbi:MAG: aspartate-semialdehyde dehydrogenase [Caldisericia bacterium]|nr:aspartate-semialdehyde dehydrogenase [Caldisericia bacterium]